MGHRPSTEKHREKNTVFELSTHFQAPRPALGRPFGNSKGSALVGRKWGTSGASEPPFGRRPPSRRAEWLRQGRLRGLGSTNRCAMTRAGVQTGSRRRPAAHWEEAGVKMETSDNLIPSPNGLSSSTLWGGGTLHPQKSDTNEHKKKHTQKRQTQKKRKKNVFVFAPPHSPTSTLGQSCRAPAQQSSDPAHMRGWQSWRTRKAGRGRLQ